MFHLPVVAPKDDSLGIVRPTFCWFSTFLGISGLTDCSPAKEIALEPAWGSMHDAQYFPVNIDSSSGARVRITRVQLQFFGSCPSSGADGAHFRAVLFGVPPGTPVPSLGFNPASREAQLGSVFDVSCVDYETAGGWWTKPGYTKLAHFLAAPLKDNYVLLAEARLSRTEGFKEYLSPILDVEVMGRLILVVFAFSLHGSFCVRNLVGILLEHAHSK